MVFRGVVKSGLGVGTKLGYPTANLEIYGGPSSGAPEDGPPYIGPGVYAARATYDGAVHDAVVVIGARYEKDKPLVEVLILDFRGDLYGKTLDVEVLAKVSGIKQFADEAALKRKIEKDIKKARLCLQG